MQGFEEPYFVNINNDIQRCYNYQLGKGSFGVISYGVVGSGDSNSNSNDSKVVAIKGISDPKNTVTEREIKALLELRKNKSVIDIYEVITIRENKYLVMEFANRGNLEHFILKNNNSDLEIRFIFKQIASVLLEIHMKNIMHRDIKCTNIVICDDTFKFLDFGESKLLPKGVSMAPTMVGTLGYINPQVLLGKQYSYKADVFSLGVTLYYMYYKRMPIARPNEQLKLSEYQTSQLYKERLDKKQIDQIFTNEVYIDEDGKDLLKGMMRLEESERLSLEKVLSHPYLTKFVKKGVFSPKRTGKINKALLMVRDERIRKAFVAERRKKWGRDLRERFYFEREKCWFLNNCVLQLAYMKTVFPEEEISPLIILVSSLQLLYIKSFYNVLDEKEWPISIAKAEKWDAFYSKEFSYFKESWRFIKEALDFSLTNHKEMVGSFSGTAVPKDVAKYMKMDWEKEEISMELVYLVRKYLYGFLKNVVENLSEIDDFWIVKSLYDLLLVADFFGESMAFRKKRKQVNLEKFVEEQSMAVNVKIMKRRLRILVDLM